MNIEKRYKTGTACLKLEDRGASGKPKIAGYAAVFNSMSESIGGMFRETIRPGAFRKSLQSGPDICALIDHEPSKIMGRKSAGTLVISEDERGLYFEIPDPPDTTYSRDAMESLRRGDLINCSFGFCTVSDEWRTQDSESVRELVEVEVFDVSLVTYPAYPDSSVGLRSLEKFKTVSDPLAWHFKRLKISDKSSF